VDRLGLADPFKTIELVGISSLTPTEAPPPTTAPTNVPSLDPSPAPGVEPFESCDSNQVSCWRSNSESLVGSNSKFSLFGSSIALSADGRVLAVGERGRDRATVYDQDGSSEWIQRGSVFQGPINTEFGGDIAISDDGNVVAISSTSMVRVMRWGETQFVWQQLGEVQSSGNYGPLSVTLSGDGFTMAIGTLRFGDDYYGQVRVYEYDFSSTSWTQKVAIDGESPGDLSGVTVALSSDGSIIAIGAVGNGNNSGHVRVYKVQQSSFFKLGQDIDGEAFGDRSGSAIALSSDGSVVAVGARDNGERGNSEYYADRGHVRVYKYGPTGSWAQMGQDIDGEADGDGFGFSVALSSDGSVLAIAASNGFASTEDATGYVQAYRYNFLSGQWVQFGEDVIGGDLSRPSVSLSSSGSILAISDMEAGFGSVGKVDIFRLQCLHGILFRVELAMDEYPGEVSWTVGYAGFILMSGGSYVNSQITEYAQEDLLCVPTEACLQFTIYDSGSDGLCCNYGTGGYKVYSDGQELASGGEFDESETVVLGKCES
jgi:hypothetical protein